MILSEDVRTVCKVCVAVFGLLAVPELLYRLIGEALFDFGAPIAALAAFGALFVSCWRDFRAS